QLERGVLRVRPVSGDLGAAVTDEVERMRPAVEALGATVSVDSTGSPFEVPFDHDAMAQVLQNLVDNAEKYSRGADDRSIRISLRRVEGGGRATVEIVVADHGPGVEAALAGKLFRPFARGAAEPAGIGLGLSLGSALARA